MTAINLIQRIEQANNGTFDSKQIIPIHTANNHNMTKKFNLTKKSFFFLEE